MARNRKRNADEGARAPAGVSDLRLLARVLALSMVAKLKPDEKLALLLGAGFSQGEVAEMLDMNPVSVRTAVHRRRKRKGGR